MIKDIAGVVFIYAVPAFITFMYLRTTERYKRLRLWWDLLFSIIWPYTLYQIMKQIFNNGK